MKSVLTLVFVLLCLAVRAQNDIPDIQTAIDQTVWKPFQKAFETLDAKALNATYADEVLRVTPNGIDTEGSFKASNVERFDDYRAKGASIALDFWFDSRHTNKDTSYEVGFYRIGTTAKNGDTSNSYGQFHIVLKKIAGQWKITQDWDTAIINGLSITAKDFEKQNPLKF